MSRNSFLEAGAKSEGEVIQCIGGDAGIDWVCGWRGSKSCVGPLGQVSL